MTILLTTPFRDWEYPSGDVKCPRCQANIVSDYCETDSHPMPKDMFSCATTQSCVTVRYNEGNKRPYMFGLFSIYKDICDTDSPFSPSHKVESQETYIKLLINDDAVICNLICTNWLKLDVPGNPQSEEINHNFKFKEDWSFQDLIDFLPKIKKYVTLF